MKGEIRLIDNNDLGEVEFSLFPSPFDFSLTILVDEEHPLESQLKNKEGFKKCMDELKSFRNEIGKIIEEEEKEIKIVEENFDNLFDNVEYIVFSFDNTSIIDFIKENPFVLSKKIVLNKRLEITDYDELIKLMDEYIDIIDKVYVSFEGNDNYASLKDCYKAMDIIKKQADSVRALGMSPMEEIMYVYDMVRNRVYRFEDSNEAYYKSRDLTEVLVGDKIVCLGYANIFSAILLHLGINNYPVFLKEKNKDFGHARNVIYVKDPKYNINGVYYFDPTWDSKKQENDNSYLYRYKFFAKTKAYMDNDKNFDFTDNNIPEYSLNIYDIVKKIIDSKEYEELIKYRTTISHMGKIVGVKHLLDLYYINKNFPSYGKFNTKEFLKKFKSIVKKFNREIPAETMLEVLNNVRKIEYYQDSDWYPYTIDDLYRTLMLSDWEFLENHLSQEERFLAVVFGQKVEGKKDRKTNYLNYGKNQGLFKDIEQVRLAKVLQKALQKKL